MNQAIIAAVIACNWVGHPVYHDTGDGMTITVSYAYPPGYEECPALVKEQQREEIAERAAHPGETDAHAAYRRGVEAMK